MIRTESCPRAAVLFLLLLCLASGIAAAGMAPPPFITVPANDTPLAEATAHGPSVPLSAFETPKTITLLSLESNQTTFPGPRDMAFGPRSIRLTTDLPTLTLLVAAGCLVVAASILFRRKKALKESEKTAEGGPEPEATDRPPQ